MCKNFWSVPCKIFICRVFVLSFSWCVEVQGFIVIISLTFTSVPPVVFGGDQITFFRNSLFSRLEAD